MPLFQADWDDEGGGQEHTEQESENPLSSELYEAMNWEMDDKNDDVEKDFYGFSNEDLSLIQGILQTLIMKADSRYSSRPLSSTTHRSIMMEVVPQCHG